MGSRSLPGPLAALGLTLGLLAWPGPGANAQSVPPLPPKTAPTTSRPALQEAKVLLVDDDESDNNNIAGEGKLSKSDQFYRKALQDRGIAYDAFVVKRYADGPTPEQLRGYRLVIWYTGASYGGNRDNTAVVSLKDEETLRQYVSGGGSAIIVSPGYLNNALGAGGAALWAKKESAFLQEVLGVQGGRGLVQRFKPGAVVAADGRSYTVEQSPQVEAQFSALNPGSAQPLFTASLDPDGKGARSVPVATGNAVGSGHVVYVGFTLENVAAGADAVFATVLAAAGTPAASGATQPQPAAGYPKRLTAGELTIAGTGQLAASSFVPKRLTTAELTITGTGDGLANPAFAPKKLTVTELTITGTGSLTK
jgi:hypothetical protein